MSSAGGDVCEGIGQRMCRKNGGQGLADGGECGGGKVEDRKNQTGPEDMSSKQGGVGGGAVNTTRYNKPCCGEDQDGRGS